MGPLVISRFCVANGLGSGAEAMLRALRGKLSGLAPCHFDAARIDTYIGSVPGLDDFGVRPDLRDCDCRNNRLAQLMLNQVGFAREMAAACAASGTRRIRLRVGRA